MKNNISRRNFIVSSSALTAMAGCMATKPADKAVAPAQEEGYYSHVDVRYDKQIICKK